MLKYIDIHNHILFGLDDGPKSIMESMKMIDMAAKEGIKTIVATPHVRPGKKIFDHIQYSLALDQLNSYCAAKAYGLQIVGGAEIKWNENTIRLLKQGLVPTMNNTRFVLVEWSASSRYEDICDSFGEKIAGCVLAVTFDFKITDKLEQAQKMFLNCIKFGNEALIVKCADLLDNIKYVNLVADADVKNNLFKKYDMFLEMSKQYIGNEKIYSMLENEVQKQKEV